MKKKKKAEAIADALGHWGQRKKDFVQGYLRDHKHKYGRAAAARVGLD